MANCMTVIINDTNQALDMKVGNHHSFYHFTTVERGAKHTMQVDFNATYQEFFMGVDNEGKKLIVNSDDCCDHKCITIKEVEGRFYVVKEPRMAPTQVEAVKKPKFNWRFWM